ncbi:MAG: CAP domain-containing protein [Eubacteriaceae bacterium]|nr:CAP domain-containing protein [Eubacteriaceae bacterium]
MKKKLLIVFLCGLMLFGCSKGKNLEVKNQDDGTKITSTEQSETQTSEPEKTSETTTDKMGENTTEAASQQEVQAPSSPNKEAAKNVPAPAPAPAQSPAPAPTTAPAPSYNTTGKGLPDNHPYTYSSAFEDEMLRLVNEYRVSKGVGAVGLKSDLKESARYKSLAMLQLNYFGHENPNFGNKNMDYLLWNVFGFTHYSGIGENLGMVASTSAANLSAQKLFEGFKNSPAHNENMLKADWTSMGIGIVLSESPGTTFKSIPTAICTQHFGK